MANSMVGCRPLGIASTLRLAHGALFALTVLVILAWVVSLHFIEQAQKTIDDSTAIERTVLDMDRLLEKARRLHGDFFLQYDRIGLAEAHVQFAQPSVRLIAEAIAASSELRRLIDQSAVGASLSRHKLDLNLYLASAKRFADTSIESIELITRLAAPEDGLEAGFVRAAESLLAETAPVPAFHDLGQRLIGHYQQYRITRQRHEMQSVFNLLNSLQQQIESTTTQRQSARTATRSLLERLRQIGAEILDIDQAIKGKFNDFNMQSGMTKPLTQTLVTQAKREVQAAQTRVTRLLTLSGVLLAVFALLALAASLLVFRFVTHGITARITALTQAARQIHDGDLSVAVAERPADELGQLGRTFNVMCAQLRELIDELELKVRQRTLQLGESEQRFRQIADTLPNVAIIGFTRDRRVFLWNRTCERLYGFSRDEAAGQPVERLVSDPAQRPGLIARLDHWIEQGVAMPAGEATFTGQGGNVVRVFASSLLLTNGSGEQEMYCIHIDLSELKKAQEERALHESLYRSLFDHTGSGVGVCAAVEGGRDFLLKDINRAGETIEGYPREAMVGRRLTELFPGVEDVGLLAQLRQVWQTGVPLHLPPTLYRHGDRQRWQQGHIYKIPSGEVVYVYDNVTQLKEAEFERAAMEAKLQRARKMEAIGLLAGGVAHDLNNILSGIVSYPDLILMQLDPGSTLRKPVLAMQESGQRAAAVVADLLTVARGVSSERRVCSLNDLVREYLASPEHEALLALHPGVLCVAELADDLWPLACSPIHLKKSLMNLVTNGAEAIARTGRIVVRTGNAALDRTAALKPGVEPGRYVRLEVADSGSGIAEADLEHIFEPFYTKKVMGRSGTGLGLAVVWNTIQDHRGGVAVASSSQGTVFTLYFPVATEDALPVDTEENLTVPPGNGEAVLVVDDEPLQRDIAFQTLDSLGYRAIAVASGEEAVAYLEHHSVDLVLLDMLMGPGINGRETYERLIRRHPGQKALIASGFSASEEVRQALRLGVCGYLQKPYTRQALARAIAAVFSQQDEQPAGAISGGTSQADQPLL